MKKKKVLIILYNLSKAQEHEWFVKYMNRNLFDFRFVLINGGNGPLHEFLKKENIPVKVIKYSSKKDMPLTVIRLFFMMLFRRFDIVHAHLFEATLAGLIASKLAGVPKRIATRHYSDYHHVYNLSAVSYDQMINRYATDIVAISKNVQTILVNQEKVPHEKVKLIYHGINFSDYAPGAVSQQRVDALREKYSLKQRHPVIGVISKFVDWKGVQYIIPAFAKLLAKYPDAVLMLANAHGPYKSELEKLLQEIPERNYRLIKFEGDITALYKTFDCFVHVPVTPAAEAFGQVYLEALASGIPSVFTLSGIAPEFLVHEENSMVVAFKDSDAIYQAMITILDNPEKTKQMVTKGYNVVNNIYDVKIKFDRLEQLYLGKLEA